MTSPYDQHRQRCYDTRRDFILGEDDYFLGEEEFPDSDGPEFGA